MKLPRQYHCVPISLSKFKLSNIRNMTIKFVIFENFLTFFLRAFLTYGVILPRVFYRPVNRSIVDRLWKLKTLKSTGEISFINVFLIIILKPKENFANLGAFLKIINFIAMFLMFDDLKFERDIGTQWYCLRSFIID